jgi:hypothetical protein
MRTLVAQLMTLNTSTLDNHGGLAIHQQTDRWERLPTFNKRIKGCLDHPAEEKRKPASSAWFSTPIIKPTSSKAINICGASRAIETSIKRDALGTWQPAGQSTAIE